MFRIKVASTSLNLNDAGCSFTASTTIQVLTTTCMSLPTSQLIFFNGGMISNNARLDWETGKETPDLYFEVEKSTDALHFQKIATVNAAGKPEGENYSFKDNEPQKNGVAYYRIKLISGTGFSYSHMVTLYSGDINFEIKALLNPFAGYLTFDAIAPDDSEADIILFDSFGRIVKQKKEHLYKGLNKVILTDLGWLNDGNYVLRVQAGGRAINKKIIRIKN